MDIYRKELTEIYQRQHLEEEALPERGFQDISGKVKVLVEMTGMCAVITDGANNESMFVSGDAAHLFGLPENEVGTRMLTSSDEDFLYVRMHPEDLVDLRMLEYEFLKKVDTLASEEKMKYKASAEIRMDNGRGGFVRITKSTQVAALSPKGKIWLILCCYEICTETNGCHHTNPRIICHATGNVERISFVNKRTTILTSREKEIITLIRDGLLSKEISEKLGISLNTVNRHRQNILEKLSVNNSMEAVNAAIAMKLI